MGYRAAATVIMWIAYLAMVWTSMIFGNLGVWAILLAFVLMMPLIPITAMMWGAIGNQGNFHDKQAARDEIEKRKRDRLDAVLRDLSDEDLQRLKRRLSDGTVDDSKLYQHLIGDDGELVDYNR